MGPLLRSREEPECCEKEEGTAVLVERRVAVGAAQATTSRLGSTRATSAWVGSMDLHGSDISRVCLPADISRVCSKIRKKSRVNINFRSARCARQCACRSVPHTGSARARPLSKRRAPTFLHAGFSGSASTGKAVELDGATPRASPARLAACFTLKQLWATLQREVDGRCGG